MEVQVLSRAPNRNMKNISVAEFQSILASKSADPSVDFVNVCTLVEFREKHIPGVRSIPLDEVERRVGEFARKRTIYVHCRSGNRSRQAIALLEKLGVTAELVNVDGGLLAWEEASLPTESAALSRQLPLMRQVMIAAGGLTVTSFIFAWAFHPLWIYLAGFVGAGLLFSGLTGKCGMAWVLAKAPWNR